MTEPGMSRKIPEGLHTALYELLDLLGRYNSDGENVNEEDFQKVFEDYNYLWAILGYSSLVSQPKRDLLIEQDIQGDYIEPDFVAYNEIRERWEIVDLKLPKTSLQLGSRKRRKRFTAEIEDYIVQVEEYSRYFNENDHREHVKSEYDIEIPPNPPAVLILGSHLEQNKINKILNRYNQDISVIQYDKILSLLEKEFRKKSGEGDGLPGITIASRITLMAEPTNDREYIFDIARSAESERISLYLTSNGDLTLEVISDTGLSIDVSVAWEDVLEIGEQKVLYVEFATTEELSFARVFAGSEILDEMILTMKVPFAAIDETNGFRGLEGDFNMYVGANVDGANGAKFALNEHVILSKAESLDERIKFIKYLLEKSEEEDTAVFFEEDAYMRTQQSTDLESPEDTADPIYREKEGWMREYIEDS